jgi:hypothetical protein
MGHQISSSAKKWRVSLRGHPTDLRDASRMFSSAELMVTLVDQEYVLESSHFDPVSDGNEVLALTASLLHVLNGIAKTRSRAFEALSVGHAEKEHPDGSTMLHEQVYINARASPKDESLLADGTPIPTNLQGDVTDIATASARDDSISRALAIYGALGDDWRGLYMVLDVIEEDAGGERALLANGWAPPNEIKLFKQTANNYGVIGLSARHGTRKPMRKKPMSVGEARRLIRTLLQNWLASKGL